MNVGDRSNFNLKNKNLKHAFFSKLPLNVRILLLVFIITLVFFYIFFLKSPDYSVLYNNLSNDDEKSIVLRLIHLDIPFKFNKNHTSLLIPKRELKKVYFDLLEQGLPKEKKNGFELLDTEKFGLSQFNEQVNYQRALEGELARSIQKLNSIKTARVHIVLPKSSLFIHERTSSSASIILEIKPSYHLDRSQIDAILNMVSRSISGLLTDNITIIDQFGNLLNTTDSLYNNFSDSQLRYSSEIEARYKKRIENILIPLVGINNVHAQVTAQINFDKHETSEEKYAPNYNNTTQSIRSRQSKKNIEFNKNYIKNFAFSHKNIKNSDFNKLNTSSDLLSFPKNFNHSNVSLKSLPKQFFNNENNSFIVPKSSLNQDSIINYELNHVISHNVFHVGNIKRLSAAVIIDYVRDKHGKLVSLNKEELNNIKKLVCESIGFSKIRGDSVSVINFQFFKPKINVKSNLYNWDIPFIFDQLFKFLLILLGITLLFVLNKKLNFSKSLNKKDLDKTISQKQESDNNLKLKNNNKDTLSNKDEKFKNRLNNVLTSNPKKIAMIIRKWISGDKL